MLAEILHIFVLCSFALAQPLFDLLSRNAEFFVLHYSGAADILVFVFLLCVGLPAVLVLAEEVVGWFGQRIRQRFHLLMIASLTAAIALQALKRMSSPPGTFLVAGAVLLGIGAALSYQRFSPVRMFLTFLSPSVLLFPSLFLLNSPVFRLVFPPSHQAVFSTAIATPPPVIMVVFDEFPLTALMDEDRQIDPIRYPNFATFAHEATWFRAATTVSYSTPQAVPAILTGNYPDPARLPNAFDYPHNLFTLLGSVYDIKAFGTVTHLCPEALCQRSHTHLTRRLYALLSDLTLVYLHLLLPKDLSTRLPSISQNWGGFTSDSAEGPRNPKEVLSAHFWSLMAADLKRNRLQQFMEFVHAINSSERPTLYFLHILLPHGPYNYLPSGKIYSTETDLAGLLEDKYVDDEWAVTQLYQRHLLQVSLVDTLLGKLLTHLKDVGIYDRSLIMVTADHGVSFRPGDFRRKPVKTTFHDIMPVPLFIKAPYQHQGQVSDANVETIDILPTIANILGITPPWPVDGRSALSPSLPERTSKVLVESTGERLVFESEVEGESVARERQRNLFGSRSKPVELYKIGPYRDLLGRHVDEINVIGEENAQIDIDQVDRFAEVDPEALFIPAHITGRVRSVLGTPSRYHLAIAISGTIQAVTQTWTFPYKGESGRWSAVVDETAFRAGRNDIEAFLIAVSPDGRPVLARPAGALYSLSAPNGNSSETIYSAAGTSIPVRPDALQGWVDRAEIQNGQIEFAGWAADIENSQLPETILIFVNGQFLFSGRTHLHRPEIVQAFSNPALQKSGFSYSFPLTRIQSSDNAKVRFFAVSKNGVASELHYPGGYPWR